MLLILRFASNSITLINSTSILEYCWINKFESSGVQNYISSISGEQYDIKKTITKNILPDNSQDPYKRKTITF